MSINYLGLYFAVCFFSGLLSKYKHPVLFGFLKVGVLIVILTFSIVMTLNFIFDLLGNEIYYPVFDIMLIKVFPKPIYALLIGYALIFHTLGGIVKCYLYDSMRKNK